jgi:hypothetical protein
MYTYILSPCRGTGKNGKLRIIPRCIQTPADEYYAVQDIKAFYMRINDDGKTVAAMDVLVPRV